MQADNAAAGALGRYSYGTVEAIQTPMFGGGYELELFNGGSAMHHLYTIYNVDNIATIIRSAGIGCYRYYWYSPDGYTAVNDFFSQYYFVGWTNGGSFRGSGMRDE